RMVLQHSIPPGTVVRRGCDSTSVLTLEVKMKLRWSLVGLFPLFVGVGCTGELEGTTDSEPLASKWAALTSGGVEATVALQSDWGSGYCADVFLDNHGSSTVTGWSVVIDPRQSSINQQWNGNR